MTVKRLGEKSELSTTDIGSTDALEELTIGEHDSYQKR